MQSTRPLTILAALALGWVSVLGQGTEDAAPKRDLESPEESLIANGDFEVPGRSDTRPAGWLGPRQAWREQDAESPSGGYVFAFRNQTPGRESQARQIFDLDGRMCRAVEVRGWLWTKNAKPGQKTDQLPRGFLAYFDQDGRDLGGAEIGPWLGDLDWTPFESLAIVPRGARFACLWIGLSGATGEARFDGLVVTPRDANPSGLTTPR